MPGGGDKPLISGICSALLALVATLTPISATQAGFTPVEDGVLINKFDFLGQGGEFIAGQSYSDVKIVLTKDSGSTSNRTSTALIVNHNGTNTVSGYFSVINTIPLNGRGEYDLGILGTIRLSNNNGVYVQGGSTLYFDENTESVFIASLDNISTLTHSAAISAKNTKNSVIDGGVNTVTVQGKKVQIIGDLDVSNTQTPSVSESKNVINLILSSTDSFWYGNQLGVSEVNTVNLTLKNGGEWIYRDSSTFDNDIDNLTMEYGGVVNLNDAEIEQKFTSDIVDDHTGTILNLKDYYFTTDYIHTSVTIGNLKGDGGIFKMDLSHTGNEIADYFLPYGNSDYITISKSSEKGTHIIDFDADAADISNFAIGDKIYFAKVADSNVEFVTTHDGVVAKSDEVFDFVYGTGSEISEDQTYWYFTRKGNVTGAYQPFMKGAAFASYSLATDMDRLNKRRGESRYVSGTNDGLWVRYAYTDLGWDNAFDMDKHMVQLGYDREFAEAYGKHYFGAAFDYTHADIDIDGVSGDNNSERYALNLYYTWLADNGLYADFVLKGGLIDSDYDVKNSAGANIGSDFKQWFYGVSAETGYKFDFANRLFIEPQAQLQFIHLEGDDFTTDGGVKAKIDDLNSLIGRVGFRAGYDFSINHDMPDSNFYIKADVMHEFDGDKSIDMRGRTTAYADEFSGDDTWYDVGIGTDLSITENTKLWIDAEHIFGADYDNTWQINAGARYEF